MVEGVEAELAVDAAPSSVRWNIIARESPTLAMYTELSTDTHTTAVEPDKAQSDSGSARMTDSTMDKDAVMAAGMSDGN